MSADRVPTSRGRTRAAALTVACLLALAGGAAAQPQLGSLLPQPRITILSPCGAKAGTTVDVTLTGTDLDDIQSLRFSHPGIKATLLEAPEPKEEPKGKGKGKGKGAPAAVRFQVAVAGDVPSGPHDARLVTARGVSNARAFVVGTLNEAAEKEPNNDLDQAQRIDVGTTANGNLANPTDVDYYVFRAAKGQRVVVACLGPSIDSRINPEMKLVNAAGKQLGYHRPPPGEDAVIDFTAPEDGDYYVRLCQFTYTQGNPEYFYRLNISTGPWIDAVFPAAVEPGKTAKVTLYGRNLPGGKVDPTARLGGRPLEALTVDVTAPKDPAARHRLAFSGSVSPVTAVLDGFEYRLNTPAGASNPVLISFARAPVVLENPDNDSADKAQQIPVPCDLTGRIEKPGDRDWYAFNAKKDTVYIIEVISHRLGAPTDMVLVVRNATGKAPAEMTLQDDNPETLSPTMFYSQTRDPAPYRFVAPADGRYEVLLYSQFGDVQSGVDHVYRLRISPEEPDFRLVVMPPDTYRPDTCVLNQGGNRNYTVFAHRLDGFKGEIELSVEGLPPGVTCKPQVLGPGQKQTHLVLSAAADAAESVAQIKVKGKAIIAGKPVTHEARPAAITWAVQAGQNIPTLTRLNQELFLAVRGKALFNLATAKDGETVIHGNKVTIPLKLARLSPDFKNQLQIQPIPLELPQGVQFPAVNIPPDKSEATAVLNVPATVAPGRYTIVFQGFAPVSPGPKAKPVNVVQPSTPFVLTVLPKSVANLSVGNANLPIKPGQQAELLVKVARLHDFTGEFRVELALPKGVAGVTAEPVTIPAGASEAKLIVRVPEGTAVGPRQNLSVRAVATVEGVRLEHETKFNVNVTK